MIAAVETANVPARVRIVENCILDLVLKDESKSEIRRGILKQSMLRL